MTSPVPDAGHQAALVARLEAVERTASELRSDEEARCRAEELWRTERADKLRRLARQLEALRREVDPREAT